MSSDPERPSRLSQGDVVFNFTEKERLYDRVRDERFLSLLRDEQITVHQVTVDRTALANIFLTL